MSSLEAIKNESYILRHASMWAHHLKESIKTHKNHKGHLVLALDPKKLETVAKKYRPEDFPDLNNFDMESFAKKDIFSKIKVKYPTTENKGITEHKSVKKVSLYKALGKGFDVGIIAGTIAIALVSAGIATLTVGAIVAIIVSAIAAGAAVDAMHQHRENKKEMAKQAEEDNKQAQPLIEFVLKPKKEEAPKQLSFKDSAFVMRAPASAARAL